MKMEYACITDVGLLRDLNQDSYLCIKNQYGDLLALVADGIGGANAGEVASGETIKYFNDIFLESGPFSSLDDIKNFLRYHIKNVNKYIYKLSITNKDYQGMGTTLTGILISSNGILSINCGDSRVYGFIDGSIIHLTKDHTLVNQMLEKGEISKKEALNHPKKHYLTKAIGVFENSSFDIHEIKKMDYYLVCSDGLHSYVDDDEIKKVVLNNDYDVSKKVIELKDLSLLKGGYDNVTLVLVRV